MGRARRYPATAIDGYRVAQPILRGLIEWFAAVMLGQGADAFLGTQGNPWDTQTDMLMALIGAICVQAMLGKMQDKQIGQSRALSTR